MGGNTERFDMRAPNDNMYQLALTCYFKDNSSYQTRIFLFVRKDV